MPDREKIIERIHEAIDMGVCVDLFMDVLELLKEQEQEISFLKAMQFQTVKGMDERELGQIVGKTLGLWR